jgi:hypothetical protein
MQCARLYCAEMSIQDVSTPIRAYQTVGEYHPGYDLLVHNGVDEYHVEVKGTSLSRVLVKITRNEMRRASVDPAARLAIVSRIRLTQDGQQWKASGGVVDMYKWVQQERLRQILQSVGNYSQNGLSCKVDEWTVDPESCEFLARVEDEFRPGSV